MTGTLFTSYTPRLVLGSSCSFFVGEGLLGLLEFLLLHGWPNTKANRVSLRPVEHDSCSTGVNDVALNGLPAVHELAHTHRRALSISRLRLFYRCHAPYPYGDAEVRRPPIAA